MPSVQPVTPAELRRTLEIVLASPGAGRATRQQVNGFVEYLEQCPVTWEALRDGPPAAPRALFFALLLPGRTGIVMIPMPGELGMEPEPQQALLDAGLAALCPRGLHYVQALLEPDVEPKRLLLEAAGFRHLAPLAYLERDVVFPWVEPPAAGATEWLAYSPEAHAEFARVVLNTYTDSRDCPELAGLRPIEDILAAHKASGRFDPGLWQIARADGRSAGCLLLAELTGGSLLEIVYMGVLPEFRRRGVGRLLMRRAFELCRTARVQQLTVVVDGRNEPAKRLYADFGLTPIAQREVLLYSWAAAADAR